MSWHLHDVDDVDVGPDLTFEPMIRRWAWCVIVLLVLANAFMAGYTVAHHKYEHPTASHAEAQGGGGAAFRISADAPDTTWQCVSDTFTTLDDKYHTFQLHVDDDPRKSYLMVDNVVVCHVEPWECYTSKGATGR